jgi:cysteine protease ATG4
MDTIKSANLDSMDYSFLFDDSGTYKTNKLSTQQQQQQQQRNTNSSLRSRTLSSTYHFISSPIFTKLDKSTINDRSSIFSLTNHDDDFSELNLDSYRRLSRNQLDYSSLPSQIELENDTNKTNELDKMKGKITSLWNNVKYGWTTYSRKNKTNFDKTSPICILGRFYSNDDNHVYYSSNFEKDDYCYVDETNGKLHQQHIFKTFDEDINTRLWFTYRKEFPAINGTKYTSDAGWGCMLRSAQMLIGQAFLVHFLGRGWSLFSENSIGCEKLHREIISWFNDRLSNKCPFGLHRLLLIANNKIGKKVGDWFGPGSIILIVRDALEMAKEFIPILKNINIYVAQDCTIYKQDVLEMCLSKKNDEEKSALLFTPVIVLVSVRLGGEELNEIYIPTLKMFLEMDNCLGIIGGKPKHSLYFIGYQGCCCFFCVILRVL